MVVTEIALLHLKNNSAFSSPANEELRNKLHHAIKAEAAYAGAPVFLLSQVEDPSYIYVLGRWNSAAQHMEEWVPSEKNQELMESMKDEIEVAWVQHVDMDLSPPENKERSEDGGTLFSCAVVAIERYFVESQNKDAFNEILHEKGYLKDYVQQIPATSGIIGGWRVDRELDEEGNAQEEFVLMSGWQRVEEHLAFADTGGFNSIKNFIKGSDIKHAKWVDDSY